MIKLYTFPESFGLRNVSPFCLKTEMALKYLDMPFEIIEMSDPRKAPKGKLPYIELDGEVIADSELILCRLDELSQGGLYGKLTPAQKGTGFAFTRLAEDHLYWMMVASRWLDDEWFPNIVSGFFGFVPGLVRGFAARGARNQMKQTYDLQGLGRHTMAEQQAFARRDLASIADVVAVQPFLLGDTLSGFDFAVAGLIAGLIDNKPATWLSTIAEDYPALREYAERVQSETGCWARVT